MKVSILFLLLTTLALAGPYHPNIDYIFPLPDSKLLTPKTTIILKLEQSLNDTITDLESLIQVDGEDGEVQGRTFFAADERTILFKPSQDFKDDEFVDVTINLEQLSLENLAYTFHTAKRSQNLPKSTAPALPTQALEAEDTPVRLINGVAVPGDFPSIEAHQYAETASGMVFYATNYPQEGTGNYLIICKNDGTPYFYRRYDDVVRSGNLTVHPTGDLTAHFYFKWFYVVLDSNFVEVDTIRVGHGYETDNHELQILENGHALLVARDRVKMDMSQVVSGGQTDATVEGHHFQELDADHNVIFEWRSWDHYNIKDTKVNLRQNFIDYVHMNSIAIDYDGHYVISARDLNELTKINRRTGEIIWRLNGENNQFTFVNDPARFIYQHDFRPLAGKPNHYTLFDNGRGRNPQYSRAVEYKIDAEKMTVENVWEYRHSPDWYASSMGSAQRLANGNTFVDFPAGQTKAVEVDPDGAVLFEFFSKGHSNYRCRRFQWQGMMKEPYLITENLGATVRLIFNKFGDESVDHYNIYYGTEPDPTDLLASTSETFYDASDLQSNQLYYFRVTAVSQDGIESGFSNPGTGSIKVVRPGENAVRNGTFESRASWRLETGNDAGALSRVINDEYRITITRAGNSLTDVRLLQNDIIILQNKEYVFEFDAYASSNRAINAKVEAAESPHINYGRIANTAITTRKKHYEFPFTMTYPTDTNARVIFYCGRETGDVYIDNVSLTYNDPESGDTVVKINFQPETMVEAPESYLADIGQAFGNRGNGFTYGWLGGENLETRFRDGNNDLRYATLNHLQKNDAERVWECALPNDTYFINLVMGDAGYTDQLNHLQIEDMVLQDPDGEDHFDEYVAIVEVDDGRLTIRPTSESQNAKLCFIDINRATSDIDLSSETVPETCRLYQNYPNPFNHQTTFKFDLSRAEQVQLIVYDLRGRLVDTVINKPMNAGAHHFSYDASSLASGLYLYRLESPSFSQTRKMMLIK